MSTLATTHVSEGAHQGIAMMIVDIQLRVRVPQA